MNRFIEAIRNMFRVEDLRKRVLFTLALLAVYRIGAHIPTPGINVTELERIFTQAQGSALGLFDLFSGGNFRNLTIFALGDRKSTRLNSSHQIISYAVFCLKKKTTTIF